MNMKYGIIYLFLNIIGCMCLHAGVADFDQTERILAFERAELAKIKQIRKAYGATMPLVPANPNSIEILALVATVDRAGSADLRPMRLERGLNVVLLKDGRYVIEGYWSKALLQAIREGKIQATYLTEKQFSNLYEEDPGKQTSGDNTKLREQVQFKEAL